MTSLQIDNSQVALSTDFEIDYYVTNPFFSRSGEYTYDMDINLDYPDNQILYEFINKKDISKVISNRKALLSSGPRRLIYGTEVILAVEDNIAKIQLVGGNSELNYLSAGKKNLRELDLGIIPELTKELAVSTLGKKYPDANFVCPPVIKTKGIFDLSGTQAKTDILYNELEWDTRNSYVYKNGTQLIPQPFLLYYVEKVVKTLGYNLIENVLLDDERAKSLVVVNGINAKEYKYILPKWTVDEFFTEIEKLFNVLFLVDRNGLDVHIVNTARYYESSGKIFIDNKELLDSIEKKFGEEDSLYVTYDNVSYKLPSGRWYAYQDVSKEILDKRTVIEVDNFDEIFSIVADDKLNCIFRDKRSKLNFVFSREDSSYGTATYGTLCTINELQGIENESSNNNCELKIVPSEIYGNNVYLSRADFGGEKFYDGWITAATPVIANVMEVEKQERLFQEIENGISKDETTDSNLFVAIYAGLKPYMYSSYWDNQEILQPGLDKILIPQCIVNPYFVHYRSANNHPKLTKLANDKFTLSIRGDYGFYKTLYDGSIKVNTENQYIFRFIVNGILDPKKIFIIANKMFYCKELHYKITPEGLDKIVEGTFFLM